MAWSMQTRMNENRFSRKGGRATGRSPLLVSCLSWFKSIFKVKS